MKSRGLQKIPCVSFEAMKKCDHEKIRKNVHNRFVILQRAKRTRLKFERKLCFYFCTIAIGKRVKLSKFCELARVSVT